MAGKKGATGMGWEGGGGRPRESVAGLREAAGPGKERLARLGFLFLFFFFLFYLKAIKILMQIKQNKFQLKLGEEIYK